MSGICQGQEWDWAGALRECHRETRRVLGSSPKAEDAAQDALLRAWHARGSCRDPCRAGAWIRAIARNEALRTACRREEQPVADAGEWCEAPEADPALVERMVVLEALQEMSGEDRELLVGRYWLDLTHAQLAHRLSIPEGTAKVRLHRLRKRLRTVLAQT